MSGGVQPRSVTWYGVMLSSLSSQVLRWHAGSALCMAFEFAMCITKHVGLGDGSSGGCSSVQ
jgi:hypothetical protein